MHSQSVPAEAEKATPGWDFDLVTWWIAVGGVAAALVSSAAYDIARDKSTEVARVDIPETAVAWYGGATAVRAWCAVSDHGFGTLHEARPLPSDDSVGLSILDVPYSASCPPGSTTPASGK